MNNLKNAGMQKMTDKVMRGGSPLAQQMEDDGTRWKNLSTANQPEVKRRKDGSTRKKIKEVAKNIGYGLATVASAAIIGMAGSKDVNNKRKRELAKAQKHGK